jgi:hypothetical protein
MQYFRAYQYAFDHPKWGLNLLLAGLCMMIPVVGPIVLSGWLFEVIAAMHRRGERDFPAFDFGRFVPYLSRGVWPFLVQLVVSLLLVPVMLLFMGVMIYVIGQSGGKPEPGLFLTLYFSFLGTIIVLSILLSLVTVPMVLRAGLMQEFRAAFSMPFALDFVKKMWPETLLVQLFLMVSAPFVTVAGLLMCCIGVIPAQALVLMAQAHLTGQLYQKYLERGGMAIPLGAEGAMNP